MPTYNEAGSIKKLILQVEHILKNNFEVIVVDDNSPDETWKIVKDLQKSKKFLKLVLRTKERGLPSAIKEGITQAKGEYVCWFDCDDQMPLEKLTEMREKINNCDIVIGSRFIKGGADSRGNKFNQYSSWLANLFAIALLGTYVHDWTSGFILAKKEAVSRAKFEGAHGSYFIDMIFQAAKKGYKIVEVPYVLRPRPVGESKTQGLWPYIKTGSIYIKAILGARFSK